MKTQILIIEDGAELEFPYDFIKPSLIKKILGFHWYDGEFERCNYENYLKCYWQDLEDFNKTLITRAAEDIGAYELILIMNQSSTKFAAGCFVKVANDNYN